MYFIQVLYIEDLMFSAKINYSTGKTWMFCKRELIDWQQFEFLLFYPRKHYFVSIF